MNGYQSVNKLYHINENFHWEKVFTGAEIFRMTNFGKSSIEKNEYGRHNSDFGNRLDEQGIPTGP